MQNQGGANATYAIQSTERQFFVELLVDWNRDGLFNHALSDLSSYADNIQVDRNLAGATPSEVFLIEGGAAAEMTFNLGGTTDQGLNFIGVFSPYNGLSPLYNLDPVGCEIKYRLGVQTPVGVTWYPQFIGNIRIISPNRSSNGVEISALDRVEALRNPVVLPAWGMSEYASQRGYDVPQMVESTWLIDHCLRFGDTSPTPYRPLYDNEFTTISSDDIGMKFWLTGNGGHLPSIGSMDAPHVSGFPSPAGGRPMYWQGGLPHPASPNPEIKPAILNSLGNDNTGWNQTGVGNGQSHLLGYWGRKRVSSAYVTHYAGFTLSAEGSQGVWYRGTGNTTRVMRCFLGSHLEMDLTLYQGNFRVEVRNYNTTSGFTTSWKAIPNNWNIKFDVKCRLASGGSGSTRVWTYMDGVLLADESIGNPSTISDGSYDDYTAYVSVEHRAGISDLYWTTRNNGGLDTESYASIQNRSIRNAKYPAVLDRGKNQLSHLPQANAEEAWSIITAVAAAELGSVFWDESGVFRFWNRDTMIAKQSSISRTLSLDDVGELDITNSLDSVRNVITAEASKGFTRSQVVYDAQSIDEFFCPGVTRSYFVVSVQDVQSVQPFQVNRYKTSTTPGSPGSSLAFWDSGGTYNGYVLQWNVPGVGWQELNNRGGVDVNAYMNLDGVSMTIEVWNGWSEPVRFATGDAGASSSAAFRLEGSLVDRNQTAITTKIDEASVAKFGKRNLSLTGDYVQYQPPGVDNLLDFLLPRSVQPIPTTDAITIAGDPRLQLGDCIQIRDPDGLGSEMKLQIYGITREFSRDGGLTDTLTVELIKPPRIGRWDDAQYGLWDTSFIWS